MPVYPDILYTPSVQDTAKAIIVPARFQFRRVNSLNSSPLSVRTGIIPNDQVLIVQHIAIRSVGGGAQTVTIIEVDVIDSPNGLRVSYIAGERVASPTVQNFFDRNINAIVLFPGDRINMVVTFSAPTVTNTMDASVWGTMIPKANWQFAAAPPG